MIHQCFQQIALLGENQFSLAAFGDVPGDADDP
jgi:hypothetical protein